MYTTTLQIDGMMCGMCEAHINDVIRNTFDVKKVSSSHAKGTAQILSAAPLEEAQLRAAIEKTGYHVKAVSVAEGEKKKFSLFSKK